MRRIKLAAIKRKSDGAVFTGRNHGEIFCTRPNNDLHGCEQGFITNDNVFVGRSEAAKIAFKAGQTEKEKNLLFSEDITGDWPWAKEIIAKLETEKRLADEQCGGLQERCDKLQAENKRLREAGLKGNIPLVILDQIKQLQAELEKHRWIPVSERLPEKNGDYLVRWDTGVLEKIHFAPKFSTFYMKTNVSEVTHWKPIILPEQALGDQ